MRKAFLAANWKMNGTQEFAAAFVKQLTIALADVDFYTSEGGGKKVTNKTKLFDKLDLIICPPAILIPALAATIQRENLIIIRLGGQNCYCSLEGAYTGEISPRMLQEFACDYVIIGHSERRQLFQENDELIAKKFVAAQQTGLKPILCVGETRQQRDNGQTLAVITEQLQRVLELAGAAYSNEALAQAIIAYEPIWAIGTGLTATAAQAQEVHSFIRKLVAKQAPAVAQQIRIIYGGSVKANNAAELFAQDDIDGGLVGGAALNATEFAEICRALL